MVSRTYYRKIKSNQVRRKKLPLLEMKSKLSQINTNFGSDTTTAGNTTSFSYDSLFKKILVSNGRSLVIKSNKNKQYYLYSLKKTPLNLILNKSFLLKKFKEIDGTLIEEKYYTFSIKYENNSVDIFFDNKNYNIIGWQTEDIYKNLAVTYIYNLKINEKINEKLFLLPKAY